MTYDLELQIALRERGRRVLSPAEAKALQALKRHRSWAEAARSLRRSQSALKRLLQRARRRAGGPLALPSGRLTTRGRKLLREYETLAGALDLALHQAAHQPRITVDGLIAGEKGVLLIQRANPPFKGAWAIPGGFVEWGEAVEEAVCREIEEETSLKTEIEELVGVYSKMGRDPRGHTVSVAFALRPVGGRLAAKTDATRVSWHAWDALPPLAFDHAEILAEYRRKSAASRSSDR